MTEKLNEEKKKVAEAKPSVDASSKKKVVQEEITEVVADAWDVGGKGEGGEKKVVEKKEEKKRLDSFNKKEHKSHKELITAENLSWDHLQDK